MIAELKGSGRRLWPRFWLREWLFATDDPTTAWRACLTSGYVRNICIQGTVVNVLVFHCRRRPDIEAVSPASAPR